ncbi:Hypothetical protein CINCED_3A006292 [Cinara cedri]|uniref:Transmembrane protein n=1 Tax=Cinara cedri TaxID=506608 RepID=A0A5E4NL07_9HEMI|nr:Hypothetical protein CINCED_3A006292 [Cinara cedri]
MSDGVHDKQLLVSVAVVFAAVLFVHSSPGRVSNLSIGSKYSPTQTWAFFLLPASMLGRVGSQTKQNVQDRPASFASDVESRSLYKDKPLKDEQTDKVQPPQNDVKTTRKNTLLHSTLVIIAIILFIVLGVMGIYYWVLFYPILCKKERKYDVMQMSAKP